MLQASMLQSHWYFLLLEKKIYSSDKCFTLSFQWSWGECSHVAGFWHGHIDRSWFLSFYRWDCSLLWLSLIDSSHLYLCYTWSLQPSGKAFQIKPFNYLPPLRKVWTRNTASRDQEWNWVCTHTVSKIILHHAEKWVCLILQGVMSTEELEGGKTI